jgi:cell division protease FtsH
MSDKVGPIAVLPVDGSGPVLPGASESSQQTQSLVDHEVRRIVDEAHAEVTHLLNDHRHQLDSLSHALLKAETLDAVDAYAAAGVPMRGADDAAPVQDPDSRRGHSSSRHRREPQAASS